MNLSGATEPILTTEEWDIVHDLLSREWSELAVEIRHTDNAELKARLHRRRTCIHDLLQRLWPEVA
ncbi:MAG: hypothetical protein IT163_02165 [Bryobacterales bacterium]|nr:hypothetical protein [Bryobacterales bacterium]